MNITVGDNTYNEDFYQSIKLRTGDLDYYGESLISHNSGLYKIITTDELSQSQVTLNLTQDEIIALKDLIEPALGSGAFEIQEYKKRVDLNTLYIKFHEFDNQPILLPKLFKLDFEALNDTIDNGYEVLYMSDYMVWRNSVFIVFQDIQGESNPIIIHRNTIASSIITIVSKGYFDSLDLALISISETSLKLPPLGKVIVANESVIYYDDHTIHSMHSKMLEVLKSCSPNTSTLMPLETFYNSSKYVEAFVSSEGLLTLKHFNGKTKLAKVPSEESDVRNKDSHIPLESQCAVGNSAMGTSSIFNN